MNEVITFILGVCLEIIIGKSHVMVPEQLIREQDDHEMIPQDNVATTQDG